MASYITLELNVISAKQLKGVHFISKMGAYAVVSISGDHTIAKQEFMTRADRSGGSNPTWNTPLAFTVNESLAKQDRLRLNFQIKSHGLTRDKTIGEVILPIKELLDSSSFSTSAEAKSMKSVTYQVCKSGKHKGELHFSYKFREADEPLIAYPASMATGSSSEPNAYPPPPQPGYGYPPTQPQGAAPYPMCPPPLQHQPGYGCLPPPPQHGHGYFYMYPGTCTMVNMF